MLNVERKPLCVAACHIPTHLTMVGRVAQTAASLSFCMTCAMAGCVCRGACHEESEKMKQESDMRIATRGFRPRVPWNGRSQQPPPPPPTLTCADDDVQAARTHRSIVRDRGRRLRKVAVRFVAVQGLKRPKPSTKHRRLVVGDAGAGALGLVGLVGYFDARHISYGVSRGIRLSSSAWPRILIGWPAAIPAECRNDANQQRSAVLTQLLAFLASVSGVWASMTSAWLARPSLREKRWFAPWKDAQPPCFRMRWAMRPARRAIRTGDTSDAADR